MSKNVDDLRAALFDVIEGVKNGTIPIDRARSIAELTQVVVNSSKVEVEFLKASGGKATTTGFLGSPMKDVPLEPKPGKPAALPEPESATLPQGITGVHQHFISDKEPSKA